MASRISFGVSRRNEFSRVDSLAGEEGVLEMLLLCKSFGCHGKGPAGEIRGGGLADRRFGSDKDPGAFFPGRQGRTEPRPSRADYQDISIQDFHLCIARARLYLQLGTEDNVQFSHLTLPPTLPSKRKGAGLRKKYS